LCPNQCKKDKEQRISLQGCSRFVCEVDCRMFPTQMSPQAQGFLTHITEKLLFAAINGDIEHRQHFALEYPF